MEGISLKSLVIKIPDDEIYYIVINNDLVKNEAERKIIIEQLLSKIENNDFDYHISPKSMNKM